VVITGMPRKRLACQKRARGFESRQIILSRTYSLAEITTEKTIALADPARNEPRDLYDLWHLTSNEGVDLRSLIDAMREKLEFRGKPFEGIEAAIRGKEARLKTLWSRRLAYQMVELPQFDEVFRAVQRTLRQANLP
jgi:uncharacterized protein